MNQPAWRKSSHSGSGSCVETLNTPEAVLVRDTKHPDGPMLRYTHDEWAAFIAGAKDGEFDLAEPPA